MPSVLVPTAMLWLLVHMQPFDSALPLASEQLLVPGLACFVSLRRWDLHRCQDKHVKSMWESSKVYESGRNIPHDQPVLWGASPASLS